MGYESHPKLLTPNGFPEPTFEERLLGLTVRAELMVTKDALMIGAWDQDLGQGAYCELSGRLVARSDNPSREVACALREVLKRLDRSDEDVDFVLRLLPTNPEKGFSFHNIVVPVLRDLMLLDVLDLPDEDEPDEIDVRYDSPASIVTLDSVLDSPTEPRTTRSRTERT